VYIESFLGVPGSLFDVQFAPSKLVFVYRVIRYIYHISFPLIHIGGIQGEFRRISYADVYTTIGEYWQIFVAGVFSTSRRVQGGTDRTYITYLHVIHPERLFEWLDLFLRSDMAIGPGGHRGDV
jgi:hypothetical protein